jgi:hypothetical protein
MRFDVLAAEFGPRNPIRTTFAGCASVRQTDSKIALAKTMAKIFLVTGAGDPHSTIFALSSSKNWWLQ